MLSYILQWIYAHICQDDDDRFARILRKLQASPAVTTVVKYKPYYTSELCKRVCLHLVYHPSSMS